MDAVDVAAYRVTGPVSFDLVAVWAGYPKGATAHAAVVAARAWGDHLQTDRVVAGDFNSGGAFTMRGDLDHRAVVDTFAGWGLASTYHATRGCEPGAEPDPTWWARGDRRDHHLDYLFAPTAWSVAVTVGSQDAWHAHSDHAPLIADLTIPSGPSKRTATR